MLPRAVTNMSERNQFWFSRYYTLPKLNPGEKPHLRLVDMFSHKRFKFAMQSKIYKEKRKNKKSYIPSILVLWCEWPWKDAGAWPCEDVPLGWQLSAWLLWEWPWDDPPPQPPLLPVACECPWEVPLWEWPCELPPWECPCDRELWKANMPNKLTIKPRTEIVCK